jgi:hypothetical protein
MYQVILDYGVMNGGVLRGQEQSRIPMSWARREAQSPSTTGDSATTAD